MDFFEAFDKVRDLRSEQIDRLLDGISPAVVPRLRREAVDECYDRTHCQMMNVNYADITENDIRRFTVLHAYIDGVLNG